MRRFVPLTAGPLALLALVAGPEGSPTAAPAAEAARCSYADTSAHGPTSRARADRALRCLISNERETRGLGRLDTSSRLAEAAQRHTRDMHRREYFSHISLGGRDVEARVRAYTSYVDGSRGWKLGETLAARYAGSASPRRILASMMASTSHRSTLLTSRFRHIGVGWTLGNPSGSDRGATVAVVVGDR
ncbi:MAG: CAP domain-containing protein [Actinomycetota bacterium]|nr:CAP domain-containing protein [Actinomycetota bacterium]